jgi:hypothetical protein
MFTVTLSTIAKIWNQPQSPSIDEWIKTMWYMHNRILFSLEQERNPVICDELEILLSGVIQP